MSGSIRSRSTRSSGSSWHMRQGLAPFAERDDLVARVAQVVLENLPKVGLVLDDQYPRHLQRQGITSTAHR